MEESVIIDTIKKMKSSGLEDEIIISTLEDIGITGEKARQLLQKALGVPQAETASEEKAAGEAKPLEEKPEAELAEAIKQIKEMPTEKIVEKPEHEIIAEKTAEKVKEHLDETKLEHDLHHTTMHTALAQQTAMLEEIHKSLKEGKEAKVSAPKTLEERIVQMQVDIEKIKEDLAEAKAAAVATKELMNKVLEVCRKILLRLP